MCLSNYIVSSECLVINLGDIKSASVKYQLVNKCRAMSSSAVVPPLSAGTSVIPSMTPKEHLKLDKVFLMFLASTS